MNKHITYTSICMIFCCCIYIITFVSCCRFYMHMIPGITLQAPGWKWSRVAQGEEKTQSQGSQATSDVFLRFGISLKTAIPKMIPGSPQPMAKLQKLSGITCLVGKLKFAVTVNFYLRVHWLSESQTFLLGVLRIWSNYDGKSQVFHHCSLVHDIE